MYKSLCLVLALAVAAYALPHSYVEGGIGTGGHHDTGLPGGFVEGGVGFGKNGLPEGHIQGRAKDGKVGAWLPESSVQGGAGERSGVGAVWLKGSSHKGDAGVGSVGLLLSKRSVEGGDGLISGHGAALDVHDGKLQKVKIG